MNEISYIKRYYNLFDKRVDKFIKSEILEKQIEMEYDQSIAQICEDDSFMNARIKEMQNTRDSNLDGLKSLKEKEKKSKKRTLKEVKTQVEDALKNKKIKAMIEFDREECNSIKSILVKGTDTVNVS